MKAIILPRFGGPEVFSVSEIPKPTALDDDAVVRLDACGVNFIDIYQRTGLYPNELPVVLGQEGAGIVESVGKNVKDIRVGDRVAFALGMGAYAEYVRIPAWKLVPLPASIDFKEGAASMLQGMTADYLVHGSFELKAGHTILLHAAAGGVGLILIQMAKRLGARVLGTVSTEDKAKLAYEFGANHVILYSRDDFETEVQRLTSGGLCDVVYDSVGKDTFERSLRCLKPRGTLVLYGQASGPVPAFDPRTLAKGSLFLTRPTLHHYVADRRELLTRAGRVHAAIAEGMKIVIEREFPLEEAGAAQALLESRKTKGKVLLIP